MDQDFRIQAFEKLAGIIADKVKQQLELKKQNFEPAGISVGYPGTSVIWPGPQAVHPDGSVNIMFFFRGGGPGVMNKSSTNAVVVNADAGGIGGGPSRERYGNVTFINTAVASIIDQLKKKLGREDIKLGKLGLAGWSGGYDPIHGILSQPTGLVKQPDYVGVFDGMHHGGKGKPNPAAMKPWQELAQQAARGTTQFVVTHTAVDPGSYASSTDTANWLVDQMGMKRQPVQQWAGQGVQPKSVARSGSFEIVQLHDQPMPYQIRDPRTWVMKANIPGTSGYQHIQARDSAPDYLPSWA
jgi:hypothetical protein